MTLVSVLGRHGGVRTASGLLFLALGCGSDSVQVTPELITAYENLARPVSRDSVSASIDCYLDFSTGMGEGMRATAEINDRLKNFLAGRKVACYKVGASDDPPAIRLGTPEANFVDLRNFTEPASKLKVAVDRMTAYKNGVSFFISDFERVEDVSLRQNLPGAPAPHPIDASAWAQNQFREWLLAENRIDIFAAPYQKPDAWFDKTHKRTYPNWIYTVVLTPRQIARDSNVFKSSVAGFLLEEYVKRPPAGARHLELDPGAFIVEAVARGDNGNANASLVVQETSATPANPRFEFYAFTSADLLRFAQDESQSDKRILTIRLTSGVTFLSGVTYGIKVSDVTQALTTLDGQLHQGPPEVKKDVETGKADTVTKPESPKFMPGTSADTVFDLVYNAETRELGIKLKPDYAGASQPVIYKIDVVVASSGLSEPIESDSVLALQYAGTYRIRALGESIHLAARDVVARLSEKVLHTFYVSIAP